MFGFRKSKGRRKNNTQKADTEIVDEDVDSPVDVVVKRSSKRDGGSNSKLNKISVTSTTKRQAEQDIGSIKENEMDVEQPEPVAQEDTGSQFPFESQSSGIPNAQEIYMAKKLRNQRRVTAQNQPEEDDYIALSEEFADSSLRHPTLVSVEEALDEFRVEGEDEMDRIIVDGGERDEFNQKVRQANIESVELAQDEDEPSDWEREQLRNAGIGTPSLGHFRSDTAKDTRHELPKDEGGAEFDREYLDFVMKQEKAQLEMDQQKLNAVLNKIEDAEKMLEEIQQSSEDTQKQWDHFMSLEKVS